MTGFYSIPWNVGGGSGQVSPPELNLLIYKMGVIILVGAR